ncbi:MAG: hypothetical protein RLZZ401_817 [Pseudomonadota bacterium]
MSAVPTLLWAPQAWVAGQWLPDVLLEVSAQGQWLRVAPYTSAPPQAQVLVLAGPVLPGLVNAHSHAFQRGFAGLAERRSGAQDNFWSWRDQMYRTALAATPESLYATAHQLYTELLHGGYTQVCEFHYLHHQPSGQPYEDPLAMSLALMQAAHDSGIGLTLLPVLYERAGFTEASLRTDQSRFGTTVDQVIWLRDGIRRHAQQQGLRGITAGVAVHSLRAASAPSIAALARRVQDDPGPVHIHIAEQLGEVNDCLATTGQRPVAWLCQGLDQGMRIDARWHLVHATHVTPEEIDAVALTGATLVLCPSTEANLGDGLTDLPHWLRAGVPLAIGSDSHVTRDWREELRLAEYGQRLLHQQRNVLADPGRFGGSTAARLFEQALHAGGRAAGFAWCGIQVGARADLLVLGGAGVLDAVVDQRLDTLVFSSPASRFRQVMVGGEWVLAEEN